MSVFTIQVTRDHITNAIRLNKGHCPVAKALGSQGFAAAKVTQETIKVSFSGHRYTFTTPAKVAKFVRDYDSGARVRAFSFSLDLQRPDSVKPMSIGRGRPEPTHSQPRVGRPTNGRRVEVS